MSRTVLTKLINSNTSECGLPESVCRRVLWFCNKQSRKEGVCVHSPMVKLNLHHDLYMSNNMLTLYGKCFEIDAARHFFDEMPCRDVVSWTGMITSYVREKFYDDALELYDMMLASGQYPNEYTLSSVLKACSAVRDFYLGRRIHGYVVKCGVESSPIMISSVIDFYSKCGCTEDAYELFKYMENADTVSWTTMISSFCEDQNWKQALQLFSHMLQRGIAPNCFTFVKMLGCAVSMGLNFGKLLHAQMISMGIEMNLILKTALVDMYVKCQRMENAMKASRQTEENDVILWTTIVSGFAQTVGIGEAIGAFHEMQWERSKPNYFTYSGLLNACSAIGALELGMQIHSRVISVGLDSEVSVANALMDMYIKCSGLIDEALRVFNSICQPNVISWTSLVAGFAGHGALQDAFHAVVEMRARGVEPNSYTVTSILQSCKTFESLSHTRNVHGYIVKTNADHDIVVRNALVDAYAVVNKVDDGWNLIERPNYKDAITYTLFASRTNQMGQHEESLKIVSYMHDEGLKMDEFCLPIFLSAAASLAAMGTGKQLHCYSLKSGLDKHISVSNTLVDFYAKCGCLHDAHNSFKEITEPDTVSWNAWIFGLASNGYVSSSLSAFENMILAGVKPDAVTFLAVLYVCSLGHLVDLGKEYFHSMREIYHIEPQLDHYIGLVDLLSRAGYLEEAVGVIENMPFNPSALIYKTLLRACKLHKNTALGEHIARKGLELDPSDPAMYALLSNMYDDCGRPDFAGRTRRMMKERGLKKTPGYSWIEANNKVHVFTSGDLLHPQMKEIHEKVDSLLVEFQRNGYPYQLNGDPYYQSEMLAVALGLLYTTHPKAPIRVMKNIRISEDSHGFLMNVTRVIDREIILREKNYFHRFKEGECSCFRGK